MPIYKKLHLFMSHRLLPWAHILWCGCVYQRTLGSWFSSRPWAPGHTLAARPVLRWLKFHRPTLRTFAELPVVWTLLHTEDTVRSPGRSLNLWRRWRVSKDHRVHGTGGRKLILQAEAERSAATVPADLRASALTRPLTAPQGAAATTEAWTVLSVSW